MIKTSIRALTRRGAVSAGPSTARLAFIIIIIIYLLAQIKIHKINSNGNNYKTVLNGQRLDEHLQMPTVKPTRNVRTRVQRHAYTQ